MTMKKEWLMQSLWAIDLSEEEQGEMWEVLDVLLLSGVCQNK